MVVYAHIEVIVVFMKVMFDNMFVVTRHHELGCARQRRRFVSHKSLGASYAAQGSQKQPEILKLVLVVRKAASKHFEYFNVNIMSIPTIVFVVSCADLLPVKLARHSWVVYKLLVREPMLKASDCSESVVTAELISTTHQ